MTSHTLQTFHPARDIILARVQPVRGVATFAVLMLGCHQLSLSTVTVPGFGGADAVVCFQSLSYDSTLAQGQVAFTRCLASGQVTFPPTLRLSYLKF